MRGVLLWEIEAAQRAISSLKKKLTLNKNGCTFNYFFSGYWWLLLFVVSICRGKGDYD
jgi:hypothetical protein